MPTSRTTGWKVSIALIVIVGGGFAAWGIYSAGVTAGLWNPLSIFPTPTTPTGFSITVTNGKTLDSLSLDDFDYTLYGTDDIGEWLDYEIIESGTGLGRIAAGDLEDYTYFVVTYNGTAPEDDYDDGLGDRVFYLRWAELQTGVKNALVAYQKPSAVGVTALRTDNLKNINIAGSALNGSVNCTFIIGSNGTQKDAAYVYGWNFENADWDKPRLVLTYNATVTSSIALTIKGLTRVRVSATVYSYEFNELGASLLQAEGVWGDDATKFYKVSTAALYFGDTAL